MSVNVKNCFTRNASLGELDRVSYPVVYRFRELPGN
jgi:hypothetical protein